MPQYAEIRACVQQLAPTCRKTQHENFARLLRALFDRSSLCVAELARALQRPISPCMGDPNACSASWIIPAWMNWRWWTGSSS